MPGLEMTDLGPTDAEKNAENFQAGGSLRKLRVKAGATLLDESEVETSSVGDRLNEVHIRGIGVGSGDCRVLSLGEGWDRRRKGVTEVWILGAAAIARPPGGIHRKLHQVGEAPEGLVRTRGLAAGQSAERVQVYGVRALGREIRIDENLMGQLVFGVVVDVLRHIGVEKFQVSCIGRVPASGS